MYATVINIQDPGALALISWSRKNCTLAKIFIYCLCHVHFFVLNLSAILFSLWITATHLDTFTSFASQLCIGDRWLTIPSVYFSVWVSDWMYRQMSSHCLGSQILSARSWGYFSEYKLVSFFLMNFGNI